MPDIFLSNQGKIMNELFLSNTKYNFLSGENGRGKSFICNSLSRKWEEEKNNIAITLKNTYTGMSLAPFIYGISSLQGNSPSKIAKSLITSVSTDIPFIGNTISGVISLLMKKSDFSILTESATNICTLIEYVAKNKRVLFICDDFTDWDDESKDLIYLFMKNIPPYKFLSNAKYIIASEKQITDFQFFSEIPQMDILRCNVEAIAKEEFSTLLGSFGCEGELDKERIDEYFSITGGNIEIIKQLAFILKTPPENALNNKLMELFDILEKRISITSVEPLLVSSFLKRASVIGKKFNHSIGNHFFSDIEFCYDKIVSESVGLNFIHADHSNIEFSNETVFSVYSKHVELYEKHLHVKFAGILDVLQPSNYESKALHLYFGGKYKEAAIQYIIFLIAYYRENGKKYPLKNESIIKLLKEMNLLGYIDGVYDAYESFISGNHQESIKTSMELSSICMNIQELIFEIDYLNSLNYITFYQSHLYLQPQLIKLESWFEDSEFCETHLEMWTRCGITLILYYMYQSSQNLVDSTHKKIIMKCSKKIDLDVFLRDKLNMLSAKSNMCHPVEIAYYETKKAVDYFFFNDEYQLNVLKLYISLINHIGNCIILSEFSEASRKCDETLNIVHTFTGLQFPRMEVFLNNYILCKILSGELDKESAIELYKNLLSRNNYAADMLLIRNNYAVILCMIEDYNSAEALFAELLNEIISNESNDMYYEYFILNNCMMYHLLKSDYCTATSLWNRLKGIIPSSPDNAYFKRRNKVIQFLFDKAEWVTFCDKNWNNYITEEYPNQIGRAWDFWGRMMLFSELQTWTDG